MPLLDDPAVDLAEIGRDLQKLRGAPDSVATYVLVATKDAHALVTTLVARDPEGQKALLRGQKCRKALPGAKFAQGTLRYDAAGEGGFVFVLSEGTLSDERANAVVRQRLAEEPGLGLLRRARFVASGGAEPKADGGPVPDPLHGRDRTELEAEAPRLREAVGRLSEHLGGESGDVARSERQRVVTGLREARDRLRADPGDEAALAAFSEGLEALADFASAGPDPIGSDLLEPSFGELQSLAPWSELRALDDRLGHLAARFEADVARGVETWDTGTRVAYHDAYGVGAEIADRMGHLLRSLGLGSRA